MSILYRNDHEVDLDQLAALFNAVGWERRTADRDRLAQLVCGSLYVVSAWDGDQLAGIARAISDGAFNAYISTVAVLPACQKRSIGRALIRRLLDGRDHLQFVLHANESAYPFYLHLGLGFEPFERVLALRRKL